MIRRVILLVLPFLLLFVSLFISRLDVGPGDVLRIRRAPCPGVVAGISREIIVRRSGRPALACVGAGLSISGAAFQRMFHQSAQEPGIIGVSAASAPAPRHDPAKSPVELRLPRFALAVALTYMIAPEL